MIKTISSAGHRALVQALVETRLAAGVTQEDLASRLGCQQSLVARIESGQRRVDVVEVIRWARALGCDPHTYVSVVMDAEANP